MTFGPTAETSEIRTWYQTAYYLQLVLIALILAILLFNAYRNRFLTARFFFGWLYAGLSYLSTDILLHTKNYPSFCSSPNVQIAVFIAEVILFAILMKNDFHKTLVSR